MSSVLAAYCRKRVGYSPSIAEITCAPANTRSSTDAPIHSVLRHTSSSAPAISTEASSTT